MNYQKCEKGHYYEASKYSSCPTCAQEAGSGYNGFNQSEPSNANVGYDELGPTGPVENFADDISSVTLPVQKEYKPDINNGSVDVYDSATQPAGIVENGGFTPVVGWLVCIDGPEKGKDFRIRTGYNFIGRDEDMDICLRGDYKISGHRDSAVAYDDESKLFIFGHQEGMNPVKVNGKLIINQTELNSYDIITIGSTKLVFVPLCCDKFDWNTVR